MKSRRLRFGLVVCTCEDDGGGLATIKHWPKLRQDLIELKWDRTWRQDSPPSWSDLSDPRGMQFEPRLLDTNDAAAAIHDLLDLLPDQGPLRYLLDVVWLFSGSDVGPLLYGALKRAVEWHNGALVVVSERQMADDLKSELGARCWTPDEIGNALRQNVVWRGQIEHLTSSDGSKVIAHGQSELIASDDRSCGGGCFNDDNFLLSRNLTLISSCRPRSVPPYLLTDFRLKLKFFRDEEGGCHYPSGAIARLTYCAGDVTMAKPKLNLNEWKKFISKEQEEADERCGCHFSSKCCSDLHLEHLLLLIVDDDDDGGGKVAIVLNSGLEGVQKSYQVLQDSLHHRSFSSSNCGDRRHEGRRLKHFSVAADVGQLQSLVVRVQSLVLNMLTAETSCDNEPLDRAEASRAVQARILSQIASTCVSVVRKEILEAKSVSDDNVDDKDDERMFGEVEKRLLAHVDKLRKIRMRWQSPEDGTMRPNAEDNFLVLDAKEILKLFTSDGLARFPERCEALERKSKMCRSTGFEGEAGEALETKLKADLVWPDVGCIKYHDLYYNLEDHVEELDAEMTKMLRMCLGAAETGSACCISNEQKPIVVIKKKPEAVEKPFRRSPRKKKMSLPAPAPAPHSFSLKKTPSEMSVSSKNSTQVQPLSGNEMYKKKLRNAVYDALSSRGINEKHSLFRPCFKKLFEICKMYAKDTRKKKNMTTSQWLRRVADQNAQIVINLESF